MNRRFALIQALVSLVALAAVVVWAGKQESPHIPTGADTIAWLAAAVGLYVVATLVRAERWHQILEHTGVTAKRADCYALTAVGYMGQQRLFPAGAGEALRVMLLSPRCDASKRTLISSIVAERVLDVIALLTIFAGTVYAVLNTAEVLPTNRPVLVTAIGILLLLGAAVAIWVLRKHHFFERVRDWLRPLADSPRALVSRWGLVLLAVTFLLWMILEGLGLLGGRNSRSR